MSMKPVSGGNRGAAVLPYLQYGVADPRVVPTPGSPGMLYLRIPTDGMPPTAIGLFIKIVDEGKNTNWRLLDGSDDKVYKDPVDTIDPDANINLAAPGAVINGVVMAAGMSFLAHTQANPAENGIYTWNGAAVPATRRPDADNDSEVTRGMFTWVNQGPTLHELTGWILVTPDPITVGVTPLTFVEIPIPASISTQIDGLYFVAENGNDGNSGSIEAPFLTIQAAINKAVADGHGFASPAEILVLPSSVPYAGFTALSGINVKGLVADTYGVRISGKVDYAPDASGAATNRCELSALEITNALDHCVEFSSANPGTLVLNGCRLLNSGAASNCILMAGAATSGLFQIGGSMQNSAGVAVQVNSGNYLVSNVANNPLFPTAALSSIVVAGGTATITECALITTGLAPTLDVLGAGTFVQSKGSYFQNTSLGAVAAIRIQAGAEADIVNAITEVDGLGINYEVQGFGTLNKNNIIFNGTSSGVIVNGAVNTASLSEEWFVETRTVTATEAAAKQLVLTRMPLRMAGVITTANLKLSLLGVDQYFGPDYTLVGDGSTVDWNGLGMDAIGVAAGDIIEIGYWSSRKI